MANQHVKYKDCDKWYLDNKRKPFGLRPTDRQSAKQYTPSGGIIMEIATITYISITNYNVCICCIYCLFICHVHIISVNGQRHE